MTIEELSFISVIIAFIGGLLSFVSPCVLPLVPIYLGHLSGASLQRGQINGDKQTFLHAIGFVVGFSAIFTFLGATVGLLGGIGGGQIDNIAKGAGLILIIFGVYITGALNFPGIKIVTNPVTKWVDRIYFRERRFHAGPGNGPSYGRSFILGGAFAIGWTPCITPVLGAILTLAYANAGASDISTWNAAGQATILLGFYAAGLSLPFLLTGLAMGKVTATLKNLNQYLPVINVASGILMILVGILIYENMVIKLNKYFGFLPYISF